MREANPSPDMTRIYCAVTDELLETNMEPNQWPLKRGDYSTKRRPTASSPGRADDCSRFLPLDAERGGERRPGLLHRIRHDNVGHAEDAPTVA